MSHSLNSLKGVINGDTKGLSHIVMDGRESSCVACWAQVLSASARQLCCSNLHDRPRLELYGSKKDASSGGG